MEFLSTSVLVWSGIILAVVLLVCLYFKLNENHQRGVRIFLKTYGFWIFLICFYLYAYNYFGFWNSNTWINRKTFYFAIAFFFGAVILKYFLFGRREKSTKWVASTLAGSGAYYYEGEEYIAIALGSMDGLPRGMLATETAFMKKDLFHKITNKKVAIAPLFSNGYFEKVEFEELPDEAKKIIEKDRKFKKSPYWLATKPIFEIEKENDKTFKATKERLTQRLNLLKESNAEHKKQNEDALTHGKKIVANAKAISSSMSGKRWHDQEGKSE